MTESAPDPIRTRILRRRTLGDRLGDLISDWLPKPRPAPRPDPVPVAAHGPRRG